MARSDPIPRRPAGTAERLDELDLRVINALQIAPRAPWSVLARGVGADPGTVARRWERLRERGLAWTAVYPGMVSAAASGACVDLVCEPGRINDVARTLADDPECISLDITSGERNLMLSVRAADEPSLTAYVLDRVAALPGVLSARVHLMVGIAAEGGMWRLRALDQRETDAVRVGSTEPSEAAAEVSRRPWFWELVAALTPDGRASYERLGRTMGVSATSAQRRVAEALGSGALLMRSEIARTYSGWPVCAWYLARARAEALRPAAAALATMPEVRAVATVAGPVNLLAGVWLRSLDQVPGLEAVIERRIRGIEVVERCVVIRPVKQVGHLLRVVGTSRATVPILLAPRTSAG